jgi:hypothetical protein
VAGLDAIAARRRDEIERNVPNVLRRVGGYSIDVFHPQATPTRWTAASISHSCWSAAKARAWSRQLTLKLAPLPAHRMLGVVNFPTLYKAMECAQSIVGLGPSAVELVDRTMIELARGNPAFQPVIDRALLGEPDAILLVEFIGDTRDAPPRRLGDLVP